MGTFNTEDDYMPMNDSPVYNEYDHPEYGGTADYGKVKRNPFSSLKGMGNGITADKVFWAVYAIALIVVIINIGSVLDFLFYTTMSVLQYVILLAVVVLLGYIAIKFIFRR